MYLTLFHTPFAYAFLESMYATNSLTLLPASAGLISTPNSSSISIRISTVSSESTPRSSKVVSSVISESVDKPYVRMGEEIGQATMELRQFLFENVYRNSLVKGEEEKAIEMLRILFDYFVKNPTEMPDIYVRYINDEPVERCVCDYLSGMSDRYAVERFRELYVPGAWRRKL